MVHHTSRRAARAALTAALAAAGLVAGVPAAHAAVTLSLQDGEFLAVGDDASDTVNVSDDPNSSGSIVIQVPGTTVADPDGDDVRCSAAGDSARCQSFFVEVLANGGNDTVSSTTRRSFSIDGGSGDDVLTDGATELFGFSGTVAGGPGNDTLTGGTGASLFVPGPGADKVRGGSVPADPAVEPYKSFVADGGQPADFQRSFAQDSVRYDATSPDATTSPGVTVTLDDQPNDGAPGEGDDIGSDVEAVSGTRGNDTLAAGGGSASLTGGLGDDTLLGGPGNDALRGGSGFDFGGDGGAGSDTLRGGGGDDSLADDDFAPFSDPAPGDPARSPAGTDTLDGGTGDDELSSGTGADDLVGGPGRDGAFGFSRFGPRPVNAPDDFVAPKLGFTVTLDDAANDGQTGAGEGDNVHSDVELVTTGAGNDVLTGSPRADELQSGSGDDAVTGGGGADILGTGDGNDTLNLQDGVTDRADGGRGADSAVADLAGGQPDKADVLFNVESITGTPLPTVIDVTRIPVSPPNVAPVLTVAATTTVKTAAFLKAGRFNLPVTTNEPATVVADVLAKARFRAVGDLIIGTGRLPLGTGRRTARVSVGATNLRTFKRKLRTKAQKRKGLSLKVRVTATDALGLPKATTRTVRIRG